MQSASLVNRAVSLRVGNKSLRSSARTSVLKSALLTVATSVPNFEGLANAPMRNPLGDKTTIRSKVPANRPVVLHLLRRFG